MYRIVFIEVGKKIIEVTEWQESCKEILTSLLKLQDGRDFYIEKMNGSHEENIELTFNSYKCIKDYNKYRSLMEDYKLKIQQIRSCEINLKNLEQKVDFDTKVLNHFEKELKDMELNLKQFSNQFKDLIV